MAQISAIQMLRAAAALTVVVGHAQTEAVVAAAAGGLVVTPSHLLPWGAGVDLFFVISGFIMVVASARLFAQPGGARVFLGRRLTRILPLWWFCAALYLGLQILAHRTSGKPLPPLGDIAAAFLLWPTDLFGDGFPRPFYTLGWTLEYEMAFYALFACTLWLPRGRAVLAATLVLGAAVCLGALMPPIAAPLVLVTQPIVLEFALGMGLALLYRRGVVLPPAVRLALLAAALATLSWDGMAAAAQASDWITPNDLRRMLAWGVPAAALVAAAALGRRVPTAQPGRFARAAVVLGDASYALYLTHPFVVGTLRRGWAVLHLDAVLGWAVTVPLALLVACVVALGVHVALERPLAAALRRRRDRAAAAVPQPAPAV